MVLLYPSRAFSTTGFPSSLNTSSWFTYAASSALKDLIEAWGAIQWNKIKHKHRETRGCKLSATTIISSNRIYHMDLSNVNEAPSPLSSGFFTVVISPFEVFAIDKMHPPPSCSSRSLNGRTRTATLMWDPSGSPMLSNPKITGLKQIAWEAVTNRSAHYCPGM